MTRSSTPLELSAAPITNQSTAVPLESSASVQHGRVDAVEQRVTQVSRIVKTWKEHFE